MFSIFYPTIIATTSFSEIGLF